MYVVVNINCYYFKINILDNMNERIDMGLELNSETVSLKGIMYEASRCLNCIKKPCSAKCPLGIDVPGFMSKIKKKDFCGAYFKICERSPFPAICSEICPPYKCCESECVQKHKGSPVQIRKLESLMANIYSNSGSNKKTSTDILKMEKKRKVAIIGSGPAGLSCAYYLKKYGHNVIIFEKLPNVGGMLRYGILEERLKKSILVSEIQKIKNMGIMIYTSTDVGNEIKLHDLLNNKNFDAVFLSMGTWKPVKLNVMGEQVKNVLSFTEFLLLFHENRDALNEKKLKNIAVVGGGSVAIDVARVAVRLKNVKNVYLIYRRSVNELLASRGEIAKAKSEGVKFKMLTNVKKIVPDIQGKVKKILCTKNKLINEIDSSGRKISKEIDDNKFEIGINALITCIGSTASKLPKNEPYSKIIYGSNGKIRISEKGQCLDAPQIFAGGDMILGPTTAAEAIAHGKSVAKNINSYLTEI